MLFDTGLTDEFGTPLSAYELVFDLGFLNVPGKILEALLNIVFSLLINGLAQAVSVMRFAADPLAMFSGAKEWYHNNLVNPLLEIIPPEGIAMLAIAFVLAMTSWRFFTPTGASGTIGTDLRRVAQAFIICSIVMVLAANPFVFIDFGLQLTQAVSHDIDGAGSAASDATGTLVHNIVTPLAQSANFGQTIDDAGCARQWAAQLQSSDPEPPQCVGDAAETIQWSRLGMLVIMSFALAPLMIFALLLAVAAFWYMVQALLFNVLILFSAAISVMQRSGFGLLARTAGRAFGSIVMLMILTLISILGPSLVNGVAKMLADVESLKGLGSIALASFFGYIVLIALVWWVLSNQNAIYHLFKAGRLGSARGMVPLSQAPGVAQTRSLLSGGDKDGDDEKNAAKSIATGAATAGTPAAESESAGAGDARISAASATAGDAHHVPGFDDAPTTEFAPVSGESSGGDVSTSPFAAASEKARGTSAPSRSGQSTPAGVGAGSAASALPRKATGRLDRARTLLALPAGSNTGFGGNDRPDTPAAARPLGPPPGSNPSGGGEAKALPASRTSGSANTTPTDAAPATARNPRRTPATRTTFGGATLDDMLDFGAAAPASYGGGRGIWNAAAHLTSGETPPEVKQGSLVDAPGTYGTATVGYRPNRAITATATNPEFNSAIGTDKRGEANQQKTHSRLSDLANPTTEQGEPTAPKIGDQPAADSDDAARASSAPATTADRDETGGRHRAAEDDDTAKQPVPAVPVGDHKDGTEPEDTATTPQRDEPDTDRADTTDTPPAEDNEPASTEPKPEATTPAEPTADAEETTPASREDIDRSRTVTRTLGDTTTAAGQATIPRTERHVSGSLMDRTHAVGLQQQTHDYRVLDRIHGGSGIAPTDPDSSANALEFRVGEDGRNRAERPHLSDRLGN